jgi:hypothetical protein
MKKVSICLFIMFVVVNGYSQVNGLYQTGLTAEQNLKAIGDLTRYATAGGTGFDNRYEGTKGSPSLFDTLQPSFLNIKGQDFYMKLNTNIDLVNNSVIFIHPVTGKLLSLPSNFIKEVKINQKDNELVFRTASGNKYTKDFKEHKFFQVLKEGNYQFLKVPIKKLIAADYKDAYSPDRRYDEYTTYYKYYIMSPDSSFNQIQLTKKSLIKMFPAKKETINDIFESQSSKNKEEMVIDLLNKL